MKRKQKRSTGERSDARAMDTILTAGWSLLTARVASVGRYVAEKRIREEDESTTRKFESSFTLEALAKQVERREREESR